MFHLYDYTLRSTIELQNTPQMNPELYFIRDNENLRGTNKIFM